jgi:hypothetical protein
VEDWNGRQEATPPGSQDNPATVPILYVSFDGTGVRAFGWRVSRPDEICVEEKDRQMSMKKLNYAGEKEFNTVQ